jgi:hypothetical protein
MESAYTRTSTENWMTRKTLPGRSFIHFMKKRAIQSNSTHRTSRGSATTP